MDYEITEAAEVPRQRPYFMTHDERYLAENALDRELSTSPPPPEDLRRITATLTVEEAEIVAGVLGATHSSRRDPVSVDTYHLYDGMSDAVEEAGGDPHNFSLEARQPDHPAARTQIHVVDRRQS